MKTKDVARQYGLDADSFDSFCLREQSIQVSGTFSKSIPDSDVQRAVDLYKQDLAIQTEKKKAAERAAEEKKQAAERAAEEKRCALANMLITSGFSFDGYKITKYSGYISGDDVIQIKKEKGFFTGLNKVDVGAALSESLVKIRQQALKELKEAAYDLGCNAVIGVDFDYITLDPEVHNGQLTEDLPYVFCVTANGNAVVIEKE